MSDNKSDVLNNDKLYVLIASRIIAIYESDLYWNEKYDLIFSDELSKKISVGDYYDPDSSYESDVRAYVDAVKEKLTLVIEKIERMEKAFKENNLSLDFDEEKDLDSFYERYKEANSF